MDDTRQWQDGVLSKIICDQSMRTAWSNAGWIVLDGPMEPSVTEGLHSVISLPSGVCTLTFMYCDCDVFVADDR